MRLSHPNKNSEVYKQFIKEVNTKVQQAEVWLIAHGIDYIWNNWIGNHLYRLYITEKDLLLDFEYYPVYNPEYSYIRINFDTDIIQLLEQLFTEDILNTQELVLGTLDQREANRFLKENGSSPIYDKDVLRLAWAKDSIIYQCVVIKDNKMIRDVTKQGSVVNYGTFMILRYLTEMFGYSEIFIKDNAGNSFANTLYRIIGATAVSQSIKRKIWWNPNGCRWKINKEQTDQFIPFYFCEDRIYRYKSPIK